MPESQDLREGSEVGRREEQAQGRWGGPAAASLEGEWRKTKSFRRMATQAGSLLSQWMQLWALYASLGVYPPLTPPRPLPFFLFIFIYLLTFMKFPLPSNLCCPCCPDYPPSHPAVCAAVCHKKNKNGQAAGSVCAVCVSAEGWVAGSKSWEETFGLPWAVRTHSSL